MTGLCAKLGAVDNDKIANHRSCCVIGYVFVFRNKTLGLTGRRDKAI